MKSIRAAFVALALSLSAPAAFAATCQTSAPAPVSTVAYHTEGRGEEPSRKAPTDEERFEQKVLEQVNAVRARYGLSALKLDGRATAAAREASTSASETGNFRYVSSEKSRLKAEGVDTSYDMVELKQIVSAGKTLTETQMTEAARSLVGGWLKDPSQSKLLLDKQLTSAGVGVVSLHGKAAVTLDAFGPHWTVRPARLG